MLETLTNSLFMKRALDPPKRNYSQRGKNSSDLGIKWYTVDTSKIRDDLLKLWVPLGAGPCRDQPDKATEIFLMRSTERSDSLPLQAWHSLARSALSWFISRTSINGLVQKQDLPKSRQAGGKGPAMPVPFPPRFTDRKVRKSRRDGSMASFCLDLRRCREDEIKEEEKEEEEEEEEEEDAEVA
uniref:Uncharacterized protein n=1 Tax=Vespula pensylvanica TaxID=30213 RepID=A0A834UC22_VESPE|nr:hypothetical protein H0235_006299 [Vespula pensylvanica]